MKLYFVPRTRAIRVRWLLEEIGLPYELVRMEAKDTKTPEYLRIHPLGHVPALVDGSQVIIESSAICLYLADKFAERNLAPAPGTAERGQYYQWIIYAVATIEPVLVRILELRKLPAEKLDPSELDRELARMEAVLGVLDGALGEREFLVGEHFTAADLLVASSVSWARLAKVTEKFPRLEAYMRRMLDRPASKRSREA